MQNRKVFKFIAITVIICSFFCSCNKNQNDNSAKKSESNNAIILQMRIPSSLNPLNVENQSVADALSLCYEPLFALNDKMEPQGVLAKSISVADNCESAIITLKDSVLWHDEKKFTSADVAYTINLIKENTDLGYYECVKYIQSVEIIDALSLKLVLSRPYGQIAYSLYFPILPSHNSNVDDEIIGTGAYRMLSYSSSAVLELEKFEKWHGGDATSNNVTVLVIKDNETATSAYNTGRISAITNKSFDMQNSSPREKSRITMYPSVEYEFMGFNHSRTVFASQSVRGAISSAIDRSAIVSDCYVNAAEEANAPIHPSAVQMTQSFKAGQYNLASAGEMLFLEGYSKNESTGLLYNEKGEKLSFTLIVNKDNFNRVKAAQTVASQLLTLGVEVNVNELEYEDYAERIQRGEYDAFIGGIKLGNLYDIEPLFSQSGIIGKSGYFSKYMNLALSSISAAPTIDSLSDAVLNFDEVFSREQPICGLVFKKGVLVTSKNIMGKLSPKSGFPYKNISLWSAK